MTDSVEDHLLLMANHLKKIHKHKTSADAKHNKLTDGKIEITEQKSTVRSHEAHLAGFHSKAELLHMNQTRYNQQQLLIRYLYLYTIRVHMYYIL